MEKSLEQRVKEVAKALSNARSENDLNDELILDLIDLSIDVSMNTVLRMAEQHQHNITSLEAIADARNIILSRIDIALLNMAAQK